MPTTLLPFLTFPFSRSPKPSQSPRSSKRASSSPEPYIPPHVSQHSTPSTTSPKRRKHNQAPPSHRKKPHSGHASHTSRASQHNRTQPNTRSAGPKPLHPQHTVPHLGTFSFESPPGLVTSTERQPGLIVQHRKSLQTDIIPRQRDEMGLAEWETSGGAFPSHKYPPSKLPVEGLFSYPPPPPSDSLERLSLRPTPLGPPLYAPPPIPRPRRRRPARQRHNSQWTSGENETSSGSQKIEEDYGVEYREAEERWAAGEDGYDARDRTDGFGQLERQHVWTKPLPPQARIPKLIQGTRIKRALLGTVPEEPAFWPDDWNVVKGWIVWAQEPGVEVELEDGMRY